MNTTNQKLGMGLDSLFGMQKIGQTPTGNIEIDVSYIQVNAKQPRKTFDTEEIMNLAESIRENGILQPILVRKINDNEYEVIAGERRLRAAKLLNMQKIPAIVKNLSEDKAFVASIIENIQRSNLSLIEEAESFLRLQNEFSLTQNEIAKQLGKHRSHVANMLRISNLDGEIKDFIEKNNISYGIIKVIAGRDDVFKLLKLCHQKALTVRQLESFIKKLDNESNNNEKAKINHSQEDLLKLKSLQQEIMQKFDIKISFSQNQQNKSNEDICLSYKNIDTLIKFLENITK
ncbi:ParB/RepB/Spo0J family partition protein [Candidatus Deianiraea vastatrix]|uniref:Probable chromosome-partitioning protein ParB n=1 Tax=Candidatus Deianiraea vastatrix TaxID=2163644 RepID=A0A5B8XC64_9RICK|nr:ParB/RepB/Spo0J family partition protein [Candidatus Deianiraea vastatrix]QED22939.1 Chromosome partitioning protein ParB [Candidatus Deianiraea vastatrix]